MQLSANYNILVPIFDFHLCVIYLKVVRIPFASQQRYRHTWIEHIYHGYFVALEMHDLT